MAINNPTTWDPLLKPIFSDERIADLIAQESPTWNLIRKKTNAQTAGGGRHYEIPVVYGTCQGIGPTIAIAQAGLGHELAVQFQVLRARNFGVAQISNELAETAKGDRTSFVDSMEQIAGSKEKALIADYCAQLHGNGGGALGRLTSTTNVATATFTLRSIADCLKIHVGETLQLAPDDGTGGAGIRAGTMVVQSVDPDTGNVVISATGGATIAAHIAAAAASDYVFRSGTYDLTMLGMDAWNPAATPTFGDAFCNVDRSVHPQYLAGSRVTAGGGTVESELQIAVTKHSYIVKPEFDYCIMHPALVGTLITELGSKARYAPADSSKGAIGFDALVLNVPVMKGSVRVIPDWYCPTTVARFIKSDAWALLSAGQLPHLQRFFNGEITRVVENDDAVEMRWCGYGNLACYDPAHQLRVQF